MTTTSPYLAKERFLQTYDEHADAIFHYCYFLLCDKKLALEVVKKASCQAWKTFLESGSTCDVKISLYRAAHVAVREKRNHPLHHGIAAMVRSLARKLRGSSGPEGSMMNIIASLDESSQSPFVLHHINALSFQEIALIHNTKEEQISAAMPPRLHLTH